jgi:hypothetical protein
MCCKRVVRENNVPVLERAVSIFRDDLLSIKSGSNPPVSSLLRSSELILCDYSVTNRILFQRVRHDLHHTVWWCHLFAFCGKKFHEFVHCDFFM